MKRFATLIFFSLSQLFAIQAEASTLDSVTLGATLNKAQTVPVGSTLAWGTALLTYYSSTNTFDIFAQIFRMGSIDVSSSHIHLGAVGVNGPIIVTFANSLWTTGPTGDEMTLTLTGQAFPSLNEADLLSDNTYIDIHNAFFAAGDIRGQLIVGAAVPLPASAWLLGSGLVGFGTIWRQKKLPA